MKVFKPFTQKFVHDLKHMKEYDHVLHGDVVIYKIKESDFPENFEGLEDVDLGVLAEGEAHAHAHQLFTDNEPDKVKPAFEVIEGGNSEGVKYSLKKTINGSMFLKVENEPLLLRHQTHEAFRIYPGHYDIDFQVEADHVGEIRRVLD